MGQKIELSSVLSLEYVAMIKIANQEPTTLIDNSWDLMIELVDCATMYNATKGYSCNDGVIRKLLSVINSKHPALVVEIYQAPEKVSHFQNINELPLATYTEAAWGKLTIKQQEALKEQFLVKGEYSKACNLFLGKLHQTLKEFYPNITPADAEVVKAVIFSHNGNDLVTLPAAFAKLWQRLEKEMTNTHGHEALTYDQALEEGMVSKILSEMAKAVEMNLSGEHPEINFLDL